MPYFIGRITATGLKPNFAYQLKLTGKPVRGTRGWGSSGDDWANEKLGYAGRWWCDSSHATQTNFDDSHFSAYYKNATTDVHNIYGYLFMGSFITDEFGNVTVDFTGQNSYHIDWKDSQLSASQKGSSAYVLNPQSPFTIGSTSGYGYGNTLPNRNLTLWYEYEPGRAKNNVQLPTGKYNCRFLLTEESFHNSSFYGGYWKTVLATEDFAKDAFGDYLKDSSGNLIPDSNAANDVVFTIGLPTTAAVLSATAGDAQVALSWTSSPNATSYIVKRAEVSGGPYTTLASGLTTPSTLDTDVTNGTTYYYIVVPVNNAGEGAISNEASATPQAPAAPQAPTDLTATAVSNQIDLAWTASAGATSYSVLRSDTSGGPYTVLAIGLTKTTYTDTAITLGKTYYYVVTASNNAGESNYSNEASTLAEQAVVTAPTISPSGGTFFGSVTVTLACSTSGAQIRYTTNGTEPTSTSSLYSTPFALSNSATVNARAFKSGWLASETATANFTINPTQAFNATADTYVRDGKSYMKSNYGGVTTLEVKTSKTNTENRDAYFKFDLSGMSGITGAKLRIYATLTGVGTGTSIGTTAHAVSNTSWLESTLTWNTKPTRGTAYGSATITKTAYTWYELDVTNYVKNELNAGRRIISLTLHNPANSNLLVAIASRETTSGPQLVLTK